jgi:hypothetical protein
LTFLDLVEWSWTGCGERQQVLILKKKKKKKETGERAGYKRSELCDLPK